jgi:hypothetical protein
MIYLDVVPITKYCEEMGETLDAVNKRLQRGCGRKVFMF